MNAPPLDLESYERGIRAGNRAVLARAITLIESTHADHQAIAEELLHRIWPRTGGALRIGITGVPGVGKSTFIDAFGSNLTSAGHKIAVLAVDPTSTRTGGSILGDKTRMGRLGTDDKAFIRPSPTSGTLGGVARKTREALALCEAAGYDMVLVETVGVGQSEVVVSDMVDFFLALMLPGAGDELQGIKRGLLELADMIAVNKADGRDVERAKQAARDYKAAMHMLQPPSPNWSPPVVTCSGLKNEGLDVIWQHIQTYKDKLTGTGEWEEKRRRQQVRWMWSMLEDRLFRALSTHPKVKAELSGIEQAVAKGEIPPTRAADRLLTLFGLNP